MVNFLKAVDEFCQQGCLTKNVIKGLPLFSWIKVVALHWQQDRLCAIIQWGIVSQVEVDHKEPNRLTSMFSPDMDSL